MGRRLAALTLDSLPDLPDPCRRCVLWELEPVAAGLFSLLLTPGDGSAPLATAWVRI